MRAKEVDTMNTDSNFPAPFLFPSHFKHSFFYQVVACCILLLFLPPSLPLTFPFYFSFCSAFSFPFYEPALFFVGSLSLFLS
ncbi:MAG: hypothetical protein J3R72DRAFT_445296 [Linnemannia gamsii]|nr:MAG: hypothetical protein J3R72DRAFT_445296 [Linnemannia gamsii]